MSKLKSAKIQSNKEKIVKLLNENIDLVYEIQLKNFKEVYEEVRNCGTKKAPIMKTLKFGKWLEGFKDEDTNEIVTIERNMIIGIDGKKSDHWNLLKYYTISDV